MIRNYIFSAIFCSLLICVQTGFSAPIPLPKSGPVIEGFGAAYTVPELDLKINKDKTYKLVLDVKDTPQDPDRINPMINTAARYLNMHAQVGVPLTNIKVAIVLHGMASKDSLTDNAYQDRFNTANPNLDLLKALKQAGAEIYLCGQSAIHSGYGRTDLDSSVSLALSALTALVMLQSDGYRLVSW